MVFSPNEIWGQLECIDWISSVYDGKFTCWKASYFFDWESWLIISQDLHSLQESTEGIGWFNMDKSLWAFVFSLIGQDNGFCLNYYLLSLMFVIMSGAMFDIQLLFQELHRVHHHYFNWFLWGLGHLAFDDAARGVTGDSFHVPSNFDYSIIEIGLNY